MLGNLYNIFAGLAGVVFGIIGLAAGEYIWGGIALAFGGFFLYRGVKKFKAGKSKK